MPKPWQNSEGYPDPTAHEGLKPIIREDEEQQRRLNNLINEWVHDYTRMEKARLKKKGGCNGN
jgi:hypothetical protein